MKILLTTPPQPMHSILPQRYKSMHKLLRRLGGNKPILGIQPPYGLMYLSSYLKKAGHEVFLVDGLLSSEDEILKVIKDNKIEMAGISSVTWNWHEAKKLARLLRQTYPDLKLAIGGAHANGVGGKILEDSEDFDYAFYGDGEETFLKAVEAVSAGKKPEMTDGIAFRDNGKVIASNRSAVITDIDNMLFPDRDSLGIDNYRPSPLQYRKTPFTAMFGSRGCPFTCTFCHTEKKVRIRSAENLVEEIELLQERHGIKEVLFFDDTFTLDKKRVYKFCDLLSRKGIRLSWAANARADTVDSGMLRAMKKAGCWRLLLGIESGSQRQLDCMQKREKLEDIERAVDIISKSGIQTLGMFMFGMPTETYQEGLETVKFMKKLKLDFVSVCNVTPFPGTKIYDQAANESGFKGFEQMNMFDISYVPQTMSENQLKDLLKRSMREFYLRPSYVLRQLGNIRSVTDFVRYLRGLVIILLR